MLAERNCVSGAINLSLSQGDLARARVLLAEIRNVCRSFRNQERLARCLTGLAGVAIARGQPEQAAHVLAATELLYEVGNDRLNAADRVSYNYTLAAIHVQLDDVTFAAAWAA